MAESKNEFAAYTVFHRASDLTRIEGLTPVAAGSRGGEYPAECLDDGKGESISRLNDSLNEMTAVYWLWKHYEELGNPEHILVSQYRRMFVFDGDENYYEVSEIGERELGMLKKDAEKLGNMFSKYDFLAPYPLKCASVEKQYSLSHDTNDVRLALEIIAKRTPEYLEAAKAYFAGDRCYLYNMFVFCREDFFRYAEWIFGILSEFVKRRKGTGRTYISERLTGAFFNVLIFEGKKIGHLPVMFVTGRKPGLKESVREGVKALKEKKGIKAVLKPIAFRLIPPRLWLKRKRRLFFDAEEV